MTTAYDVHRFNTTVHWCALSKPRNALTINSPTYGLAFDVSQAPAEIDQYLMPKSLTERMAAFRPDLINLRYHTIRQPYAPTICLTERGDYAGLVRLQQNAAIANISLDRLLSDLPAVLAVDLIPEDVEKLTLKPIQPSEKRLRLRAVLFDFEDIDHRFTRLIKEHFR